MSLPKFLIGSLKPCVIGLILLVGYTSIHQYQTNKENIYTQAQANLRTATKLAREQMKNSTSNFQLLNNAWEKGGDTAANQTAYQIISGNQNFADIIRFDTQTLTAISEKQAHLAEQNGNQVKSFSLPNLSWTAVTIGQHIYQLSNMYKNLSGRWVFALTQDQTGLAPSYYIEFDLLYMTQLFIDIRTLDLGFVFIFDRDSGQILFHPHPNRVGHTATIYNDELIDRLKHNELVGRISYYFEDQYKIAEYNAYNDFNWVFVSGALRSDIVAYTYVHFLIFFVSITLIFIIFAIHYLIQNLRKELRLLSKSMNVLEAKNQALLIFNKFCTSKRVQLCLFEHESCSFFKVDFNGNKQAILIDKQYAMQTARNNTQYYRSINDDVLAKKLQFNNRYFRVPLFGRGHLIGVIFVERSFSTSAGLINLLKTYIESTICNVLLNEQIYLQDTLTGQNNLLTMRARIHDNLEQSNRYLITLNIDNLRDINYKHGYLCGDQIIISVSDLIDVVALNSLCRARIGSDEFSVLIKASSHNHALEVAEEIRKAIEAFSFVYMDSTISFTASVGVSYIHDDVDKSLRLSQQAVEKSKHNGRNQTTMNVL
ncbi:diguanylate cyclase domain-containing protein [Vibrio gallicus]|uniref:diguanylate cyclase domain-containing protein n=1 Tax=Vibrio gallicus TaxID=190897 RepID=UPI0021C3944E|nr:diguanylate cyclase [Vibrio gallicus]